MVRLAVGALLVTLVGLPVSAWYLSGRLTSVIHVTDTYPLRVAAIDQAAATITLGRGSDAAEPGTFRLAWPGGQATVGPVLRTTSGTVTRTLTAVQGTLSEGQRVGLEPNAYIGDPRSALGLAYSDVVVPTTLGGMPAWFIPGQRSTWVLLIHGLGGSRTDTLPAMDDLHALGYPMLAVTYRNDLGAPPSPDHRSHLGATEWYDIVAAIAYATQHGATGVVLYGYSLGGAMALVASRQAANRPAIRAVVVDSPILDWSVTLDYAAQRRGVPHAYMTLFDKVLAERIHLNFSMFDQLKHISAFRVPILLIQGEADTVVPPAEATQFARQLPGLVTYLSVPGADHVSAIDSDPSGYRAALDRFLAPYP